MQETFDIYIKTLAGGMIMRIGINGRFLLTKKTGVQRAAYNLVKVLFEMDDENEYFLFTSKDQIIMKNGISLM